jgi:hypothetical protein
MTLRTEIASRRLQISLGIIKPKMVTKGEVRKIQSSIERWNRCWHAWIPIPGEFLVGFMILIS